ncbi:Dabb family protein [Variovorax rhizosphaerae]|uniref:Dabb family protein n=1 Tax=Variovorax rhizosphaerae TaxID=1836200 RepID=A0ABU8WMC0_9BURK
MIRHTVFFRLKHPHGSIAEADFLARAMKLGPAIPDVRNFKCVRQVSNNSEFDWGLLMDLADQAAYDRYDAHPVHRMFVAERWQREVEAFVEIDYLVGDEPGEA